MNHAIILAAGKGTRMKSEKPKVLHEILGKSMLETIVDTCHLAKIDDVVSVVGYGKQEVMDTLKDKCNYGIQEPQLGSGHAVKCATCLKNETGKTLVINGDCPCIQSETLVSLLEALDDADMVVLTASLDNPQHYGRIVQDEHGHIQKIVEYKDCNELEKQIHRINTGVYGFDNELLFTYLDELKNDNAQKEYYITDLVEIFLSHGKKVVSIDTLEPDQVQGVNDPYELAKATCYLKMYRNKKWLKEGVCMVDPTSVYLGDEVTFGSDVLIHPNVSIYGKCHIGNHVTIYPNVYLKDTSIKDHEEVVEGSK